MSALTIAHATDLSGDDEPAFLHACALAAVSRAPLVTVYGKTARGEAERLPDARAVALRWGRLIEHERICHECCDDVVAIRAREIVGILSGLDFGRVVAA